MTGTLCVASISTHAKPAAGKTTAALAPHSGGRIVATRSDTMASSARQGAVTPMTSRQGQATTGRIVAEARDGG